jgi:hypothetical protein
MDAMWVIKDIRWTAGALLVLTGAMVMALGGPLPAPLPEPDWLDAMMEAVLAEQANEGPFWGTFAPYVAHLTTVRAHIINGEGGCGVSGDEPIHGHARSARLWGVS